MRDVVMVTASERARRAQFVRDFVAEGRITLYPVVESDVADEHRPLEPGGSVSARLAHEIGRTTARYPASFATAADEIADALLSSHDEESCSDVLGLLPQKVGVARLLAHLESLGLGLSPEAAASVARRATIALLNAKCPSLPAETDAAPKKRRKDPPPRAPPPIVTLDKTPKMLVTVSDTLVDADRMCFECGATAPLKRRKVSGEILDADGAWATAPALILEFIEKATAAYAAAPERTCPACGAALPAPKAEPPPARKAAAPAAAGMSPEPREREVIGKVEVTRDLVFYSNAEDREVLATGTVVDRVKATAKETASGVHGEGWFVAVRWKDKTRFIPASSTREVVDS